jgi:hypothetical protein
LNHIFIMERLKRWLNEISSYPKDAGAVSVLA